MTQETWERLAAEIRQGRAVRLRGGKVARRIEDLPEPERRPGPVPPEPGEVEIT